MSARKFDEKAVKAVLKTIKEKEIRLLISNLLIYPGCGSTFLFLQAMWLISRIRQRASGSKASVLTVRPFEDFRRFMNPIWYCN